jgi:putative ABC transport system permease protein
MLKFLFKGLLRDKSRSLLPIFVVTVGVMMTVFLQAYMNGVFADSLEASAKFISGHVKVTTLAYKNNQSQLPNDYAIIDAGEVMENLKKEFPDMQWVERIQFGGLLDAPDSSGFTRSQGNIMGMGVKLIGTDDEINRMDLKSKLIKGNFPSKPGEALVSNQLAGKMKLKPGDKVTLLSNTMYGDMGMYNFIISGTVHFGTELLDKGLIIADIEDVRAALNMEDATGEILGFLGSGFYENKIAKSKAATFNEKYLNEEDKFSLVMSPMSEVNGMDFLIIYAENAQYIVIFIFILAMSIVLWNAGLVGGLRRYGEFGLRLAIGEHKTEIYRSLIGESLLVGIIGSVFGTAIGLLFAWLMQKYGINTKGMMQNANLMMPTTFKALINSTTYYIGFVPGVLSTLIGAMLAGIGIYKRQTATLFKELEN